MLSYIADEEAFDAVSFVPNKDIKFAGFSVYQVHSMDGPDVDFRCIYKIKIGGDSWPEKQAEFTPGMIDKNLKLVDIMLPQEVII